MSPITLALDFALVAVGLAMLLSARVFDRGGLSSILGMMPGSRWTRAALGLR